MKKYIFIMVLCLLFISCRKPIEKFSKKPVYKVISITNEIYNGKETKTIYLLCAEPNDLKNPILIYKLTKSSHYTDDWKIGDKIEFYKELDFNRYKNKYGRTYSIKHNNFDWFYALPYCKVIKDDIKE